jgi:hypothetical protein
METLDLLIFEKATTYFNRTYELNSLKVDSVQEEGIPTPPTV